MSVSGLLQRVRRTIQRHQLAQPATGVVAALSGGADSVALLHLLRVLHEHGDLRLLGVAHLDHRLRDASVHDAAFCRALAAQLHLPFVSECADVAAAAAAEGRSLEDAAHHLRHVFFERARVTLHADVVAVGHTMDDQAETLLLRLIRGAGARGLAGMHPRSGCIVRPLLECRRDDLRTWLQREGMPFVEDATNADTSIPRNRVRAELLPLLGRRFNPDIVAALARDAELLQRDRAYFDRLVDDWMRRHLLVDSQGFRLDAATLEDLPEALAWRVLHTAMRRAAGGRPIGFDHVADAWQVVVGQVPGLDAPGHRVERDGASVVLRIRPSGVTGRETPSMSRSPQGFRHPLAVPGETRIPELGLVIAAELADAAPPPTDTPERSVAVVPHVLLGKTPLAVRNRRPGDWLRPGPVGRRKLQNLLVDRKVPRLERDRIPIVVDAADRIVWVAGQALDRDFRVTDPAQAVVILRLKGVGGSC